MKKALTTRFAFLGICVLLVLTACLTNKQTVSGTLSLDEALAGAFTDISSKNLGNVEIVIAAIKASDGSVSDFLTDELSSRLSSGGSFIILERGDALEAVGAELDFQMTGLVNDEYAVGIGHFLGAKVVISGTFSWSEDPKGRIIEEINYVNELRNNRR